MGTPADFQACVVKTESRDGRIRQNVAVSQLPYDAACWTTLLTLTFLFVSLEDESSIEDQVPSPRSPLSNETRAETIYLRKKLRFFFLDPIEKWQTKRRLPYKFAIQVIKIFLVTYQVFH